jgi:hypothetical protein
MTRGVIDHLQRQRRSGSVLPIQLFPDPAGGQLNPVAKIAVIDIQEMRVFIAQRKGAGR